MSSKTNDGVSMADYGLGNESTKRCFVTVGATASFFDLIRAVLSLTFLDALHAHKYTELRIQYGKDGKATFDHCLAAIAEDTINQRNVAVTGFDFDKYGLTQEMLLAKRKFTASKLKGEEGCVISHAGSGSILDAMRIQIPLIVVPNTKLLHNHQVELAEELAGLNYVVHGQLDDLAKALPEVEHLRQNINAWPPSKNSSGQTPGQALAAVMDDELGWID